MQKKVLPQFGEAVTAKLKEHGLSDRAAQYRTGIDRITLADMRNGYVPRMEQVVKFAHGFHEPVNLWLGLAGYDPIDTEPASVREALESAVQLGRQKYARELEYASEEEAGPIFQYTGQTDIPDHDRALLEEAYRILEAEHRAKRGPQQ